MRNTKLFVFALFLPMTIDLFSQTPRQVVVEHFTNSRCSICASKNPSFYSLLHNSYHDVVHIAYYPSAPYSNCYFNLQDVSGNDDRTNHYGVYGSTPRAVIQGKVIPIKTPLVSNSDLDIELNGTSAFDISITLSQIHTDSVLARISVITTDTHSLADLILYAVASEDTIFYNSPNGETVHFDVYRKHLFGAQGMTFPPPMVVGDSVPFTTTFPVKNEWDLDRLSVTTLLQRNSDKYIVQAKRQSDIELLKPALVSDTYPNKKLLIYPNPATDFITLPKDNIQKVNIHSIEGKLLLSVIPDSRRIDVSSLENGAYFISIYYVGGNSGTTKFMIAR